MGPGRQHWMDALRGTAVLLIVLWHSFSMPYGDPPAGVAWVMDFLSVYRVPMLLLLSGLLLDQSVAKPIGTYVTGKLRRIAWPLLVWSVVLVLIGWPGANPAAPLFWLGDAAHLWYLGVLLACYAVGLLTRWVPPVLILAAGFVAMQVVSTRIEFVNNVLWFGLFFYAGATLSRFLTRWLRTPWFIPTAFLGASMAWAGYSATANGYTPIAHWRPLLFSFVGIVGVIWFAARAPRVRWLEWVGQRSIVFYVAHLPVIWLVMRLLKGFPPPITYALVLVAALGGCFLLARFLNGSVLFELPSRRRSSGVPSFRASAPDPR